MAENVYLLKKKTVYDGLIVSVPVKQQQQRFCKEEVNKYLLPNSN